MSQGLAVTLLRRACLAWADSLREVRVDVGERCHWEMSKSIYVALAGCPHLDTVSVPDIFLHYYENHHNDERFRKRSRRQYRRRSRQRSRRGGANAEGATPLYFRTLRHLDLHEGPHTEAAWRVICGKMPALHTLVLRGQNDRESSEETPLIWYPAYGCFNTAQRAGASSDNIAELLTVPSAALLATDGTGACIFPGPTIARRFFLKRGCDCPVYGHLSSYMILPPSSNSWRDGLSVLLKSVRIKRLYINSRALTDTVQDALNSIAARHVRRRSRSSSSRSSSSGRDATDQDDDESAQSDNHACNATRAAAAAARIGETAPRAWPRFVRTRPRHRVPEKDLISLEVFSIYGWGLEEFAEITPFVRYLARSAPHLREVGLANATAGAALALRHAVSTSLTGLDIRYMDDLDDAGFATLLRSRAGRRLRSLTVPHPRIFAEEWQYAVLNVSDGDGDGAENDLCRGSSSRHGSTPPLLNSPAAEANADGPWRLGPEPRLRRLRRVDVSRVEELPVAERVFNGRRVMFTPYFVVPPL
jgi:hypothetical protein